MKVLRTILISFAVLLLILGSLMLKIFRDSGEFKRIRPVKKTQCSPIKGVLSSEDITIHPELGLAFISSDDRRPLSQGRRGKQGAIFSMDLKGREGRLINLTTGFKQEFHPHGIGLLKGNGGRFSLFVVNHRESGHYIEIFDYRHGKLVHRESISGALMHSPNDVVPVGPRSFYVTNDHAYRSRWGRTLEAYLQFSKSYVLYYDGHNFRMAAEGLAYANGINISRDGKSLYVAATVGRRLHIYDRDGHSGDLTLREFIDLGTGVDNIEVDEVGRLWIGAHPKLLTFVRHSKDPSRRAPSQVLRVEIQESGKHAVKEVYLTEGQELSGSSVAAFYEGEILIGSVFDPLLLRCRVRE